jgi:hypothetical protein
VNNNSKKPQHSELTNMKLQLVLIAIAALASFPYALAGCNVCGDNQTITIPDATVFIPDYGNYTCSEIEAAGENGLIGENDCLSVRSFLEPCGCSVPPTPPTRHLRHL